MSFEAQDGEYLEAYVANLDNQILRRKQAIGTEIALDRKAAKDRLIQLKADLAEVNQVIGNIEPIPTDEIGLTAADRNALLKSYPEQSVLIRKMQKDIQLANAQVKISVHDKNR